VWFLLQSPAENLHCHALALHQHNSVLALAVLKKKVLALAFSLSRLVN
jgi:hypothetical protein